MGEGGIRDWGLGIRKNAECGMMNDEWLIG
jgi:hypothetical protein